MSDRPVEDEIMDEARRFGHSMAQMMRMHAQANGWWEQRKVRRQISLEMRRQRRGEQAERAHQKVWTAQMIHRYQIAAQARADRALDPRISAGQQRRDAEVDARHLDELRERIVGNARLTQVERGIALDCLETARMWPHAKVKTPELLERAPKVRGVNALRYRARLARETAWVQQRRQEREQQHPQPVREQQYQQLVGEQSMQAEPVRPTGELTLAQVDAVQKIRHAVVENQAGQLRVAGDAAALAGLTPQRIDWEMRHAEQNSKFTSEVASLRNGDITVWRTYHPTEAEATQWTAHNVGTATWLPGVQLKAVIRERGNQVPLRLADGGIEHVTARTAEWSRPERDRQRDQDGGQPGLEELATRHRLSIEHNAELSDQNARLTRELTALRVERERVAEIEARIRKLADAQEDRDRKIAVLQRSVDAVTADRDSLRTALDDAEARIQRLQNLNRGLSDDRNKYRSERDQAVQKLAQRTPPAERLGSAERQAAEREANRGTGEHATGDIAADLAKLRQQQRDRGGENTQAMPREQLPTAPETNGHRPGRNGIERSR
ncbi:hypothetical protein ACH474_12240 [Nocardia rhamnosiphila]|uniref:hypothetical protein n=1 Tax=Nocardia rhamnosiphila TaxID=426716 RepID=UPI0037AC8F4C